VEKQKIEEIKLVKNGRSRRMGGSKKRKI